jgi:hypothetical protein
MSVIERRPTRGSNPHGELELPEPQLSFLRDLPKRLARKPAHSTLGRSGRVAKKCVTDATGT